MLPIPLAGANDARRATKGATALEPSGKSGRIDLMLACYHNDMETVENVDGGPRSSEGRHAHDRIRLIVPSR